MLSKISSYLSVLNYKISREIMRELLYLCKKFIPNKSIQPVLNFINAVLEDKYLEDIETEFCSIGFFKSKIIILMRGNQYKELLSKVIVRIRAHIEKEMGEEFAKEFDNLSFYRNYSFERRMKDV